MIDYLRFAKAAKETAMSTDKPVTIEEIVEARAWVKENELLIKLHTIHLLCGSPPLPKKLVKEITKPPARHIARGSGRRNQQWPIVLIVDYKRCRKVFVQTAKRNFTS